MQRSVYELFPYPSRKIDSRSELESYGRWAANAIGIRPLELAGKSVLEAGCGTGEAACGLAILGANVTAFDLSGSSIQKALALQEKFKVENVSFVRADLFAFETDNRFDIVLSLGVLHHTKDPCGGFSRLVSWAKSGGLVCTGWYNPLGRMRLRLKRWLVGLFAGADVQKRMAIAKKLFYGGKLPSKGEIHLADKFGQPLESYHFVEEVLGWFSKNHLELAHARPALEPHLLWMQLKWFLNKKGAFFVLSGKKK
ncbi:MAG: methyltransferase domain-containing protein [Candidatus Diapherotrites archaeon]|nr:methyltransferase domain-containing protein [Candidatus Diapherotrites archaeon]